MPSSDFEVCPSCSQQTASRFFRQVGEKKLCLLCAKRADKAAEDLRAQMEDHRLHGGTGWIWKHIGYTACATIGGTILRLIILHFFFSH